MATLGHTRRLLRALPADARVVRPTWREPQLVNYEGNCREIHRIHQILTCPRRLAQQPAHNRAGVPAMHLDDR